MAITVETIMDILEAFAPTYLAEEWDNIGLLVGDKTATVKKIIVALDATRSVIQEAIDKKADMIITHHPIIFKPIKSIEKKDYIGSLLYTLIKNNISVYCAHTNLDKASGGTDDTLANILEISNPQPLTYNKNYVGEKTSFGRIGKISKDMLLYEYIKHIKEKLGTNNITYIGQDHKVISVVASCAGAGGDFVKDAVNAGAHLYITGEMKYHDVLVAQESGMAVVIAGHYVTEIPVIYQVFDCLQKSLNDLQYNVEVIPSDIQQDPYHVI